MTSTLGLGCHGMGTARIISGDSHSDCVRVIGGELDGGSHLFLADEFRVGLVAALRVRCVHRGLYGSVEVARGHYTTSEARSPDGTWESVRVTEDSSLSLSLLPIP